MNARQYVKTRIGRLSSVNKYEVFVSVLSLGRVLSVQGENLRSCVYSTSLQPYLFIAVPS